MQPKSPQDAVELLNAALKRDSAAITTLVKTRVTCNEALFRHPTVQCGKSPKDGALLVGLLGIINGIFGIQGSGNGWIAAKFDGDALVGFSVIEDNDDVPF